MKLPFLENPEDRFSRGKAHLWPMLDDLDKLLIYKIDSSTWFPTIIFLVPD